MALIQKAFSDIITFSRTSNATRVGPTGVLEYAPHNLVTASNTFNTGWTSFNATVSNNVISAPDGTVTASKLVTTASNTFQGRYWSATLAAATTYTFSIYAKAAEYSRVQFTSANTGQVPSAIFNLANGTVISGNGIIQSVGNGWYRCIGTATASAGGTDYLAVYVISGTSNSFLGDGTSGIYLWGAQLAVGPYALDYTPTTNAAVYGPRFDYDGSGVTIVEPVSTNLVLYSQEFANVAWQLINATKTSTTATDPSGGSTALTLTKTGASDYSLRQTGITPSANKTFTVSCYLKGTAGETVRLYMDNGVDQTVVYQLITLTSSWVRYSGTGTFNSTSANVTCGVNFSSGTTASSVDVAFFQLELGSTATAYMVSGATNGFRAVPVVSGSATPKGLLVEEQRTNIYTYSEDFSNAAWSKTGTTVIANSTGAPDGLVTADEITFGTGTSALVQTKSGLSAGARYEPSVYIKRITTSGEIILRNTEDGSYGRWAVNLALLGSGWERITRSHAAVTVTAEFVASPSGVCAPAFYGSDSNIKAYLWGAQLELGSFSTSYIPTLASAVTRTADVASVNTLSPWFNNVEGAFFAEFSQLAANSVVAATFGPRVLSAHNGSTTTAIDMFTETTGQAFFGIDAGSAQWNISRSGAVSAGQVSKFAGAFKANDIAASLNGGTVGTDTSATIPTVTTLQLANRFGSDRSINGHLRRVAYYPRRLTNAELQALSA